MHTIGEYPWFKGKKEEFKYFERQIAGDDVVLIIPTETKAVGAPWSDEDKIYRSSIWRISDGAPVSLGYKKFVNFGEQPDFEPVDIHDTITAIEKIDGTCLICNRYKGEYIFRTRGTFDVHQMENGYEIDALIERYHIKELLDAYGDNYTFIFEWITPSNILCVKYDEPDLYLTGIVRQRQYSYFSQIELDTIAREHGLKRPRHHEFNVDNADDMAKTIREDWIGVEGVVAYFGQDQQVLKKMKSNWHHSLHIARILVGNTTKLVSTLFDMGAFNEECDAVAFSDVIKKNFEYEVLEYYAKELNEVWVAYVLFCSIRDFAKSVVKNIKDPHEIVDALKEGKWGNIQDTFFWNAYRGTSLKKSFFVTQMLKIIGDTK